MLPDHWTPNPAARTARIAGAGRYADEALTPINPVRLLAA